MTTARTESWDIGLVGALPAALWFTLGTAPSVTYRDSGELTAAAFLLDVPHPTGFPADMALARIAMLLPMGDVAYRANLAVAALMALACGGVAVLTSRCLPKLARPLDVVLPALASVALMASSTVLRAATVMEVYAGALLLTVASLTLCGGSLPRPTRRRLSGLALGLALATHTTTRPAALVAVLLTAGPELLRGTWTARARAVAPMVVLSLLGALVVIYLPIASSRDGPIDWGDPQTAGRLLDHLSARAVRSGYTGRILVAWRFPEDLSAAVRVLVEDLGAPVTVLALAGAVVAGRRRAALPVCIVALVDLVYAVAVNPMGTVDRQTLFVTEAGMVVLAAVALGEIAARVVPRFGSRGLSAVIAACVVALVARSDRRWTGAADGWTASEVLGGAGGLGAVPARALVLCSSDDACGGAMFAQWVEGERPDVTVLVRQHLEMPTTWRRLEQRRSLLVGPRATPPTGDLREVRLRWLLRHAGERVRWEGDNTRDARGLVLSAGETAVFARVGASQEDRFVDRDAARWVSGRVPAASRAGAGARGIGAMVIFAAGVREAAAAGDPARGVDLWRAALSLWPGHVASWINLGVAEARAGRLASAVTLTRHALDIDPERPRAWSNLADFLAASGDAVGADEARRESARRSSADRAVPAQAAP